MTVKRFRRILNRCSPSPEPLCVLCSKNMRSRLLRQFLRHFNCSKVKLILASSNFELNLRLASYYQFLVDDYSPESNFID